MKTSNLTFLTLDSDLLVGLTSCKSKKSGNLIFPIGYNQKIRLDLVRGIQLLRFARQYKMGL